MDLGVPQAGSEVHPAYANPRPEVTALVPVGARRVLDVGCSVGVMSAALKERGHDVVGIEYEPALAREARTRLERVIEGDVEALAATQADVGGPYDCVCFADVLEHLRDPWAVVRWAEGLLAPDGVIVASIPNIARLETFWNVFRHRRWPYRSVGVFDRTHLRFFARANLKGLFERRTSLRIRSVDRVYRLSENPRSVWNRLAPLFRDYATLQFLVVVERTDAA
jgi:SAM-dependent methyltransferase